MSSKFELYTVPFHSTKAVANQWLSDTKDSDTFGHFSVHELKRAFDTACLSRQEGLHILTIRTRQLKRKSKQDIRKSDRICELKLELKLEGLKWQRDQLLAQKTELSNEIETYIKQGMSQLVL